MKISVKIEGGARLARELRARNVSRVQLRHALREGGQPIKSAIEAHAPHAPGAPDIRANIVMSNARADGDEVAIAIGPSKAKRDDGDVTFDRQGMYLEFGTSDTAQQPFVRPGFDEQARPSLSTILSRLWGYVSRRGASSGGFGGLR